MNLEHDAFSSDNALMWAKDCEMPNDFVSRWNTRPRLLTKKKLEDEILY